jgi:hypothetical protein
MLGGMEQDPEVGDPPLAELVGLHFGLPSNEDTVKLQASSVVSSCSSFFLVLITWYLFHFAQGCKLSCQPMFLVVKA